MSLSFGIPVFFFLLQTHMIQLYETQFPPGKKAKQGKVEWEMLPSNPIRPFISAIDDSDLC